MAEIAEMLGVTRQRVAQLIETYDDFPKPEVEISGGRVWSRTAVETWIASHPERGPGRPDEEKRGRGLFAKSTRHGFGGFQRFTDRARRSVILAQEAARLLNHNYIGTEHLLLGLINEGEGVAAKVLGSVEVTSKGVQDQIEEMIGVGTQTPQGHIPFTPRTQKVLEIALREALQLGHNYIGTEHVLLAIVREGNGVAWQVLERLGLKKKTLRESVLNVMRGITPIPSTSEPGILPDPSEVPAGEFVLCTFCGKARTKVEAMVAGANAYICDECVTKAAKIIQATKSAGPGERDAEVTSRLAALERAVGDLTERLTDELRKRDEG
jgi:ATP-dependent Clp protease ATP-binding subunit ClpA/predicted DNA-binding transcriptional regulator AlpA